MLLYLSKNETDKEYTLYLGVDPSRSEVVGTGEIIFDKDVFIRLDEKKLLKKIKGIFGD